MNKRQHNRLLMYRAVSEVLGTLNGRLDNAPALAEAVAAYNAMLASIDKLHEVQKSAMVGRTSAKMEAYERVFDLLIPVQNILHSYARKIGDTRLKETTHVTYSDLRELRDSEFAKTATMLFAEARSVQQRLLEYGLTAEQMDTLGLKIEEFARSIAARDSSRAYRSSARQELAEAFERVDEYLSRDLDRLMELFFLTDRQFYNAYQAARVVRDLGIRHEKPEREPNGATVSTVSGSTVTGKMVSAETIPAATLSLPAPEPKAAVLK